GGPPRGRRSASSTRRTSNGSSRASVAILDDDSRPAFEARIVREARRFELKPLLDLLVARGYTREEILFEGTHEGSATNFVEAVRFEKEPVRVVVLTLNLGLL